MDDSALPDALFVFILKTVLEKLAVNNMKRCENRPWKNKQTKGSFLNISSIRFPHANNLLVLVFGSAAWTGVNPTRL